MDQKGFEFDAVVHLPGGDRVRLRVVTRGLDVWLYEDKKIVAAGVWDAGRYVRYAGSQLLALPPQILDEIDAELRLRIQARGLGLPASPLRRSAVGYGDT